MGLLECASGESIWRGFDYHKENKVTDLEQIGDYTYTAKVAGSSSEPYSVELHIDHPRKSTCNCPKAAGKRIICKHIIAAYFTVLPEEAERLYHEAMAYQAEEEKRQELLSNKLSTYIKKMKKEQLIQELYDLLCYGPEWQYDRFIRDHGLDRN